MVALFCMRRPNQLLKTTVSAFLAVALIGCQATQRGTEQNSSTRLAARALEALVGCEAVAQPASFGTAALLAEATRIPLNANKVVAAQIQELSQVKFAIDPEKRQQQPGQRGGLIAFTAPTAGTYLLGSASQAWIDLVEADRRHVVAPRSYEWVELCGRPLKAGIFELRASARYVIQLSASPDPVVELFVSGPLN